MKRIKASLRADGRWEAKGIDPVTGRRKSYYSRLGPEEAERAAEASFGFSREDTTTLYGFYANVYLATVAHRSENWTNQIGWAMDKYVLPRYGHRQMQDLDRRELQLFFNGLAGSGMYASTIRGIKIIFSGVLNLAEDDGAIPSNPCRRVRVSGKPSTPRRALAADELCALLAASHELVRPFVLLTGFAGLRAGEALGTTRAHIKRGVLEVRQQVLQLKGGCRVTPILKTQSSYREIPLPEAMLEALLGCNQRSGIWICSDTIGGYLTPNNAARELDAAIVKAGCTRITPHELRHTFTTLLENEVVAPRAIAAALLGKKDRSQIGVYSHPTPRQMLPWMKKYWEVVSGAAEAASLDAKSASA